jgi:RimJ/RimL family protein N-acetyltransferase
MVIELRTPTWQDMHYIRWLWGDEETMQAIGGPVYLTDEQALEWFQRVIGPGGVACRHILVFSGDQHLVGEVSFHHFEPKTGTALCNLKIAGSERGKGYA